VRLQLFPLGTVADAGDQNVRPVSQLFRRIHELTESVCQSVRSRIHGDEPVAPAKLPPHGVVTRSRTERFCVRSVWYENNFLLPCKAAAFDILLESRRQDIDLVRTSARPFFQS